MKFASTVISADDYALILAHAKNAEIGGGSHVRAHDRRARLGEDQIVGQMGEYALARFLGVEESYFERRRMIDLTPNVGDDGTDVLDFPVDVKCSLMRYSKNPADYQLLVRPAEASPDTYYVAAFCDTTKPPVKVYLAGWGTLDMLSEITSGKCAGALGLRVNRLRPMNTLRDTLRQDAKWKKDTQATSRMMNRAG